MKNNESIRIAVAETSVIIRSGLTLALKHSTGGVVVGRGA